MVGEPPVNEPPVDIRRRRIRQQQPSGQPSQWRARALILVLLVVIGTLAWRTLTEAGRVRGEVHRQICGVLAITYTGPPATTAAGRQRQATARQFAVEVVHCTPPREGR